MRCPEFRENDRNYVPEYRRQGTRPKRIEHNTICQQNPKWTKLPPELRQLIIGHYFNDLMLHPPMYTRYGWWKALLKLLSISYDFSIECRHHMHRAHDHIEKMAAESDFRARTMDICGDDWDVNDEIVWGAIEVWHEEAHDDSVPLLHATETFEAADLFLQDQQARRHVKRRGFGSLDHVDDFEITVSAIGIKDLDKLGALAPWTKQVHAEDWWSG